MKKSEIEKELSDFFHLVAEEKRKQKEELETLVEDSFDSLFWQPLLSENKEKPIKKKRKKKATSAVQTQQIEEQVEVKEQNILIEKSLGLLSEPSSKKQNNDPITPLDQRFVTFDQLQKHYTQFLSRIQQQLSTLGGGGETNLAFMTVPVRTVSTSSYTITYRDYYVGVNYAGAVSLTLPKADREGRKFVVKDELGEASRGTNRYITIFPQAGDFIDGRDRAILAFDYGSLTFIWKSNSWRII